MPSRSSRSARWPVGKLYAKVVTFPESKSGIANKILEKQPYYHFWKDGLIAKISAMVVDSKEAASIKRQSKGFYGFDWMIANILSHGSPYDKAL